MRVTEIALPHHIEADYGEQIRRVAPDRIRLVPISGRTSEDPDVSDVEILLHAFWFGLTPVREILPALPRLHWLHSTGAGVDDLASAGLGEREVWVTNAAGAYAPAMADFVLAAMVLLARNFRSWFEAQRDRRWIDRADTSGISLRDKRVGIVGYGSVARHLAPACKALGMEVWATRRTPMFTSAEAVDRLLPADSLDELVSASDFVVVAASLNSTTLRLFDDRVFNAMKPGAYLVNIARGELIDQAALLRAQRDGKLGGAVLDVTDPEPLSPTDPLWDAPNVWITPHVSGDTPEGWQRGIDLFCANLELFLQGHPERMCNLVDMSAHI